MKFLITTLGCKVNAYESEFIKEELKKSGYEYNEDNPDIIIINTCSVTNTADNKSLKTVRKMRRNYSTAIIVVCGCSSENNQAKYQEMGIDILLGNRKKSEIASILDTYLKTHQPYVYFANTRNLDFEDMTVNKFKSHTRAFVKIQDGCNNFCSYCIIPYTRGTTRSKDFSIALKEITDLVKNGHQEIVLTGIHTGSYNSNGHDLTDLLHEIAKINDLKRIRISSIEITELNTKFINELKNNSKICNHLHIPLQSGSDNILKKMNRKYDKAYFTNKINEIKRVRPDIAITTDAIVGHPYETDADFKEYLAYCEELDFSKIHVFPYSKRDGTAASLMPQVPAIIKKERAQSLLALSDKLEEKYYQKHLNQELEVLTEEIKDGYVIGHTSNYLKVYLKGDYKLNTIYNCLITKYANKVLYGKVLSCSNAKISL